MYSQCYCHIVISNIGLKSLVSHTFRHSGEVRLFSDIIVIDIIISVTSQELKVRGSIYVCYRRLKKLSPMGDLEGKMPAEKLAGRPSRELLLRGLGPGRGRVVEIRQELLHLILMRSFA